MTYTKTKKRRQREDRAITLNSRNENLQVYSFYDSKRSNGIGQEYNIKDVFKSTMLSLERDVEVHGTNTLME